MWLPRPISPPATETSKEQMTQPCDIEVAREAFAAGREWAYGEWGLDDYAVKPPAFEEWWAKSYGGKEKDDA